MPLREELEHSGNRLFRGRSYWPLVLLPILLFSLRDFAYPPGGPAADMVWDLVCLGVGLLGLALRVVTVGFVGSGTSGRSTKAPGADSLNTSGMYSVVRHPLYLGNYLMWLAPALYTRSLSIVVIVSLAFWIYYERIMLAEEEFLRRKFGNAFEEWAVITPAFLPRWRQWRPPDRRFSFKVVLKREFWGLIGLICTLAILEFTSDTIATGQVTIDRLWLSLLTLSLVLGLCVRILKHPPFGLRRSKRPSQSDSDRHGENENRMPI